MNNNIDTNQEQEIPIPTFKIEPPVYSSHPDGSYVINFNGHPYHLLPDDETMPHGLWESVMNFIKENPDVVEPEPPPELEFEPEPEPDHNIFEFTLGLMGVTDDE